MLLFTLVYLTSCVERFPQEIEVDIVMTRLSDPMEWLDSAFLRMGRVWGTLSMKNLSKLEHKDIANIEQDVTVAAALVEHAEDDVAAWNRKKNISIFDILIAVSDGLDAVLQATDDKAKNFDKKEESRDFYEVLNVSKTATPGEIKKAYRKLALLWHPDKCMHSNEDYDIEDPEDRQAFCEKMFVELQTAYQVLSNARLREKYDDGQRDFTASDFSDEDSFPEETTQEDEIPMYIFDDSVEVDSSGWGYAWKLQPDGSRERVRVNVDEIFGTGRAQQQQQNQHRRQERQRRNKGNNEQKKQEFKFTNNENMDQSSPKMKRKRSTRRVSNACKRKHSCIGRASQPRPRVPILGSRQDVHVGVDNVTVKFSLLQSGTRATAVYIVEGDIDNPSSFLCHSYLIGNDLPRAHERASIVVSDLAPGAQYSDFGMIACASPNPPAPWDCHQLDMLECSMKITFKSFRTKLPRISGSVNRGNLDGGSWLLVRRQSATLSNGEHWHACDDDLHGTCCYGPSAHFACSDEEKFSFENQSTISPLISYAFSIPFEKVDYDEFLFSSGDGSQWAIFSRSEILKRQMGRNLRLQVLSSSLFPFPHPITISRNSRPEDPIITLRIHTPSKPRRYTQTSGNESQTEDGFRRDKHLKCGLVLYAESKAYNHHCRFSPVARFGANVWVRKSRPKSTKPRTQALNKTKSRKMVKSNGLPCTNDTAENSVFDLPENVSTSAIEEHIPNGQQTCQRRWGNKIGEFTMLNAITNKRGQNQHSVNITSRRDCQRICSSTWRPTGHFEMDSWSLFLLLTFFFLDFTFGEIEKNKTIYYLLLLFYVKNR